MTARPLPSPPRELAGDLLDDPSLLEAYAVSRGPFRHVPLAVARPRDRGAVAALAAWASANGIALVARGAGTGMPGGNTGPGVVVDLAQLAPAPTLGESGRLHAGAGNMARDADGVAARHGRRIPALPSSAPWCTLGGMVANDAAGARSFSAGPVHAWLEAVTWVRADGTVETLRREGPDPAWVADVRARLASVEAVHGPTPEWPRVRKNSSGYALDRLEAEGRGLALVPGSEGTLGIVTDVTIATLPSDDATGVALVGIPDLDALAPLAALASRLGASACEYFGRRLVELGELVHDPRVDGLAAEAGLALVEFTGSPDAVASGLAGLVTEARATLGGVRTATDPAEVHAVWELRHAASPTIARAAEAGQRSLQFIEDSVVPPERVGDYARAVTHILGEHATDGVIFGHLGDGHLHVNPLVDIGDPAWRERVRAILEAVVAVVAELGGTLAGEHGDGRLRAPFLERIWGPVRTAQFRALKDALDPGAILNPGVILPLSGQDPLADLVPGGTL